MRKRTFDIFFILISAAMLSLVIWFDLVEKYIGFSLIPVLTAYYLGQYSERKFRK